MKLSVGGTYKTRNGQIVKICGYHSVGRFFPFDGYFVDKPGVYYSWTGAGSHDDSPDDPFDLVECVSTPNKDDELNDIKEKLNQAMAMISDCLAKIESMK